MRTLFTGTVQYEWVLKCLLMMSVLPKWLTVGNVRTTCVSAVPIRSNRRRTHWRGDRYPFRPSRLGLVCQKENCMKITTEHWYKEEHSVLHMTLISNECCLHWQCFLYFNVCATNNLCLAFKSTDPKTYTNCTYYVVCIVQSILFIKTSWWRNQSMCPLTMIFYLLTFV